MAFDLEAFKKSVEEPQPAPKATPTADEKWPVRGHIIEQAWENVDPGGTFYLLVLTVVETGEVVPYSLRYGDLPGLPYAEELSRELELGLIEMQYGKPPVITPFEGIEEPPAPPIAATLPAPVTSADITAVEQRVALLEEVIFSRKPEGTPA